MGFPNVKSSSCREEYDFDNSCGIRDFQAYDGDKKLKIFRKNVDNTSSIKNPDDVLKTRLPIFSEGFYLEGSLFFECFKVSFKNGEKKQISNLYTQSYFFTKGGETRYLQYILKIGAFWKNKIDNIDIFIHLDKIPEHERGIIFNYYNLDSVSSEIRKNPHESFEMWLIQPVIQADKFIKSQDTIEMNFRNVEPSFNLELAFPASIVGWIEATSTLKSKNNAYDANHVYDNDPKTAWVEGVNGSGINEKLTLSDFGVGDYSSVLVDRIGIINGYAKSNDTFQNNNRVKQLKLELLASADDRSQEMIVDLQDKMDVQYIVINNPIFLNSLVLTILDVYKGKKYDDTCISEIQVFTTRLSTQ